MSTFEIVRGVEGDCLVFDGTRICGPKPWGGGRIIDTFRTDGIYEVIDKDEYRKLMTENAKLREQVERLRTQLADMTESVGRVEERCAKTFEVGKRWMAKAARFEAENAKLRELAAGIGHLLLSLDVDYCAGCPRDDINHPCPVYTVKGGECLYETDLRDLGVEVD